jgi:hypothetical protein
MKGFLVGIADCTVLCYERNENDIKNPYKRTEKKFQVFFLFLLLLNLLEQYQKT